MPSGADEAYLLLDRRADPGESSGGGPARGHVLAATPSGEGRELVATGEIEPGRYLVRARIAGVVSRPDVDENPSSPTHRQIVGPEITIVSEKRAENGG